MNAVLSLPSHLADRGDAAQAAVRRSQAYSRLFRFRIRSFTAQLPVAQWHEMIGEPMIADAILDRIVHNAYRITLEGDSMRKQKAQPLLQFQHKPRNLPVVLSPEEIAELMASVPGPELNCRAALGLLAHPDWSQQTHQRQAVLLNQGAGCLLHRFKLTGARKDLDEAILLLRIGEKLLGVDDPSRGLTIGQSCLRPQKYRGTGQRQQRTRQGH